MPDTDLPDVPKAPVSRAGCFAFFVAAILVWGLMTCWFDGGVSCCFALFVTGVIWLLFNVLGGRD